MAEYFANALANIPLNEAIDFEASIPCARGYVFHEDGTGVFILRGVTSNCFARYRVTYTGNIAVPTGGTVAPIAVAIALNGEQRMASRAIITPADVDEYGNVTSTAIITVPRGCCFSVSVRYVSGVTDGTTTPPVSINQINGNLTIDRIA